MGKNITYELKRDIVKFYTSRPMALREVVSKFNLCSPTISKILNEFNCTRYQKSKIFNPGMIEDYFTNIDTEEKAYFIGLILSDGNIFKPIKGQASISITLNERDDYLLSYFKKALNVNTTISSDGRGCNTVVVRSNQMAQDLARYGICPRKSLKGGLPTLENKSLMRHLIRGILDGDGSIQSHLSTKTNKHCHKIDFCGSLELITELKSYLVRELGIRDGAIWVYPSGLAQVRWGSIPDMTTLGDFLYKDATIYMTRKYDKFTNFINHYDL